MQQRGAFAIEPALEARQHLEEHLHVRGPGYRVGDDLVVVKVHHGRKVELRAAHLEFGDIGHQLGHRALRLEVAGQQVRGRLADLAHVESVLPASAGPAQQPLLAHDLEHRLVGDTDAGRFAQRSGNASVSIPELRFLAYLHYDRPLGRLPVGGRVRLVVVVGGTRHPHELQERGEWVFPPQRLHYLVLPPVAERSVAEAAIRFKISTSISRRAHRCSRVSSLAGSFLLRPDGWTTRCLCQAGNEQSGTRNLSSLADGLVKRSPSRASAPHPCGGSIPRTR